MAQRGRPKEYEEERVVTAVRLPKSLLLQLKHTALARETSVNDLLTRAARELLDREGVQVVDRAVGG